MNGPEHYLEAERLTAIDDLHDGPTAGNIALAQVHATLALAAAVANTGHSEQRMHAIDFRAWDRACGVQDDEPDDA